MNLNSIGDLLDRLSDDSISRNVEDYRGIDDETVHHKGDFNEKSSTEKSEGDDSFGTNQPDINRAGSALKQDQFGNDLGNALEDEQKDDLKDELDLKDLSSFEHTTVSDDRRGLDEQNPDRNGLEDTPDDSEGIDSLFFLSPCVFLSPPYIDRVHYCLAFCVLCVRATKHSM